jgi:hypothetical protein
MHACYHALDPLTRKPLPHYGQRVQVVIIAPRGVHPRNVLIRFVRDGGRYAVTNYGCLRWHCRKHVWRLAVAFAAGAGR